MADVTIDPVLRLMSKGVSITKPECVEIGPEVDPERISGTGVRLYPGCRIYGSQTLILSNAVLGSEGPVTIENCYLGPQVHLKGGYFKAAVFLRDASVGSGAHVREGTILEEEASAAHAVGLKQTILFPFVTLGSLINFCDCLMSGGTSRKDHSEVGSSYIHFNYTPNQDKATASLLGDVPRGVMLDQRPIFLGGQGGLVGPCRLAFGTTLAAGAICRKDELRPGRLILGGGGRSGNLPYTPGAYTTLKRVVRNNVHYIANLIALDRWYRDVRGLLTGDAFPVELLEGLRETLALAIRERIHRLAELCRHLHPQKGSDFQRRIYERQDALTGALEGLRRAAGDSELNDRFLELFQKRAAPAEKDYIRITKTLSATERRIGTAWLQSIVDGIVRDAWKEIE